MSDTRSEYGRRWSRVPIWVAYAGIAAFAFHVPLGVHSTVDRSFLIVLGSVGVSAVAALIAFVITLLRPNDTRTARPLDEDSYETARLVCLFISMAFLGKTVLRLYQAQQGADLDILVVDVQNWRIDSVAAAIWFLLCVPKRFCVQQRRLILTLTVAVLILLRIMTPDAWSGIYGIAALYFLSISLRPTFKEQDRLGKGGRSLTESQAEARHSSGLSSNLHAAQNDSIGSNTLKNNSLEAQPIALGGSSSDVEEKYALLLKYSDKTKAAAARLSGASRNVIEEFRRRVVAEPSRADDIAAELLATLAGKSAPFESADANKRYAQLEPLGWQAQAEFRKVVELLGAEADPGKIATEIVRDSSAFKIQTDKIECLGRRYSWNGYLLEDLNELKTVIAEKILNDAAAFSRGEQAAAHSQAASLKQESSAPEASLDSRTLFLRVVVVVLLAVGAVLAIGGLSNK